MTAAENPLAGSGYIPDRRGKVERSTRLSPRAWLKRLGFQGTRLAKADQALRNGLAMAFPDELRDGQPQLWDMADPRIDVMGRLMLFTHGLLPSTRVPGRKED